MFGLLIYSERFKDVPETKYFQIIMFFAAFWSLFFALSQASTTVEEKILLMKIWDPASLVVTIALFGLAASHYGKERWLTRRNIVLLSIVPAIVTVAVLTVDSNSLYIYDAYLIGTGVPYVFDYQLGIIYYLEAFYCYGLLIASAALIIRSMMGVNPIYKNQGAILLLGMSIPALAEALAYVDVTGQDFAPCFFGVSGVIYAIGLYSYRLLDIRPLARGEIMENMTDAVLVIDTEDRLVDFNRVASSKLFKRMPNPAGSFIFDAVSFDPDFIERYYGEEIFHREVTLKDIEVMNTFDVSIMPLLYKDQIRGRMILMRDISDRKYMEDTLHIYNIGRQNLLNKIDEIEKHLASVRSDQVSKESKDHLESMNDLLRSTRSLVSFFNDNEDLKAHAPKWHDVGELIRCAKGRLDLGNVRVESRVNGLFIYGDALMERVFFILMENSLRHERQVSTITVDYQDRPDHMSIIYEDDGTESPMADTPGIFDCQFGTKTRSVLFLTREILAISDIKITECGEPRKGARFELDIPHDACLFNTKT